MASESSQNLPDRLRAALKIPPGDGGDLAMTAALRGQHPADIAEAMTELANPEALAVFNWIDNVRAAEVLDELPTEQVRYLLEHAPPGRITDLLDRLPMDDVAEIISEAKPEQAETLLTDLSRRAPQDAAEVRELLSYPDDSAGRLMTDQIVRLSGDLTVEQVLDRVRNANSEVETLSYLYVTDAPATDPRGEGRLLGIISLRDLVRAKPQQTARQIMVPDPITVMVDTDQEEVARQIAKYDLMALPVIDGKGFLAGIVTVDDVVDVLQREQTEDVLKLGAVTGGEESYLSSTVSSAVRGRVGWLLLLFLASTMTGGVMKHYEGLIKESAALAVFLPLLIGTGGNAGAQAVMTVTRAIALGDVKFSDWLRVLWRELRTGLILGAAVAAFGFLFVIFGQGEAVRFGMVVAFAMVGIVIWASLVGSLLPIGAKRLGFDPAVMSAPFITTLVDATGLFLYFNIARIILRL